MKTRDAGKHESRWTIRKFSDDTAYRAWLAAGQPALPAEQVDEIDGNLLLNEGIALLLDLGIGAGGTTFANANAYLGVGDSSTAAGATQTGLQATTNKLYKAMEAGYPQRASQTVTWRSVFGESEANWAWGEFTVANGNSDSAVNLNRKVESKGTKSGGTWTLDLAITIS